MKSGFKRPPHAIDRDFAEKLKRDQARIDTLEQKIGKARAKRSTPSQAQFDAARRMQRP